MKTGATISRLERAAVALNNGASALRQGQDDAFVEKLELARNLTEEVLLNSDKLTNEERYRLYWGRPWANRYISSAKGSGQLSARCKEANQ